MTADVILIVCDTARADAFEPWGGASSPAIALMCREGWSCETVVASAPWTLPSTASIFTGELPTEHWISADSLVSSAEGSDPFLAGGAQESSHGRRPPGGNRTGVRSLASLIESRSGLWLPRAFRDRGYSTWGGSCNPWVSNWNGFSNGFDRFEDIRPPTASAGSRVEVAWGRAKEMFGHGDHGGRAVVDRFIGWLRQPEVKPRFGFVNLMELHDSYDPPLRYHPLFGEGARTRDRLHAFGMLHRQLRQRNFRGRPDELYLRTIGVLYEAAARYEDRLVGLILEAVRNLGRPTLVVVTSDHGEMLGEHQLFEHHSSLHEPLLRVPLAVWGVGVETSWGRAPGPIALKDLAPWLVAAIDSASGPGGPLNTSDPIISEYESTVKRPGGVTLRPDLRRAERAGAMPALAHDAGLAVRIGDLKYVAVEHNPDALYDLSTDPHEEYDLLSSRPEEAAVFAPLRQEWEARRASQPDPGAGALAEAEIEDHLRSLGYLE